MLARADLLDRYLAPDRSVPRLRVSFISSLDGAATAGGLSGGLNNPDDKVVFDTLRMLSDAIIVGSGTVRAEGYGGIRLGPDVVAWRQAAGLPEHPTVVVVSSRLDLAPAHPVFTNAAVRTVVITHEAAPSDKARALAEVADVVACGREAVDVRRMVDELASRGFLHLLCEGGPHLFSSLVEADCVDELCLTIAPVMEAGPAVRIAHGQTETRRRMTLRHAIPVGDMLFLRYDRAGTRQNG